MTDSSRSITRELKDAPKYLYKYFSLTDDKFCRVEQAIIESKLYFAQPKKFNDPFDCNIPTSFKATQLKAEKYWKGVARRQGDSAGKQMNQMVREKIAFSRTNDGKKTLNNALKASINKNGVASFSTDNNNTLMWAYYASSHTGVSLRFNTSLECLNKIHWQNFPIRVDYQDNFPEINYYEIRSPVSFLARCLGTKSIAWGHEKEWRLVSVGTHGLLPIPNNMIDGIILGLSIDSGNEERIRKIIEDSEMNIELLRVVHKARSYELEVVPA